MAMLPEGRRRTAATDSVYVPDAVSVYTTLKKLFALCKAISAPRVRCEWLVGGASGVMRTDNVQSASAAQSGLTLWSDLILKNSSRVINENEAAAPAVARDKAVPLWLSVNTAASAGFTVRALEPPVPILLGWTNNRERGTAARGVDAVASYRTTSPHSLEKLDENSILNASKYL
jgi:hypothetical protein